MGPIRLAIIAGLIYLIYRLLTKPDKGSYKVSGGSEVADDLLVEDPVCHTYVAQKNSEFLKIKGKTYYFCSEECRQKFKDGVK